MRRSDFVVDGMKRCSRCREIKPTTEFNAAPKRPSGYRPQCKACHAAVRKENRPPEYFAAWFQRRCAEDPAFRAEHRRRAAVSEKSERGMAARRARENEYFRRHPEKRSARNRTAYALRRGSGGKVTPAQWRFVQSVFSGLCAYCRERPGNTMDHFVPVAAGGKHDIANVVPACRSCNSSKRHRDPFEWMASRGVDGDAVIAGICETRHFA